MKWLRNTIKEIEKFGEIIKESPHATWEFINAKLLWMEN